MSVGEPKLFIGPVKSLMEGAEDSLKYAKTDVGSLITKQDKNFS